MSSRETASQEIRHGRRIVVVWAILAVICAPIVYFVWGPHMPPGNATLQAADQQEVNRVLGTVVAPILLFIWVYFVYAIATFRQTGDSVQDGPPIRGNSRIQGWWIAITSAVVLCLAVYATIELVQPSGGGVGGGQGPNPIAVPAAAHILQVQVIGQQWVFTYRYPSFGGVETTDLVLPTNTTIEFHVTSLDVIHSFWAYNLGVKADAVPGTDNVAFATTRGPMTFTVRCSELCGLYHAQMFNGGRVVPAAQFSTWIQGQVARAGPILRYLPPYSPVYYADPNYKAG